MDKDVVGHTHAEILLRYKKEHMWVSSNEVDKPRAYYMEGSQKDKGKYHTLMHIYGILKDSTDDAMCRAGKET